MKGLSEKVISATSAKDYREIGSSCNDDGDGDGNENGKKALGLDKQNNNFARASRFFVHLIAVFAGLQRETAYCNFKDNNFLSLFPNFDAVLKTWFLL